MSTVSKKCYEKLSYEFNYLKAQTVEPCTTVLEFISREKMIDNVHDHPGRPQQQGPE